MAEAAAIAAPVKFLFQILAYSAKDELGSPWSTYRSITKLKNTLSTIQDVLDDAEEHLPQEKALSNWLKDLKDAAYDADDVLDEFRIRAPRGKVRAFFSLGFRFRMARKIKKIQDRLNDIAEERTRFHLEERAASYPVSEMGDRLTHSGLDESEVYGRDEDKNSVVDLLVGQGSGECVSVLPIVGMGGLGKTTLAQLVFNDKRIKGQFETRVWVCVSEDFDVKRVTKAIIESIVEEECRLTEFEPLQRLLQRVFGGRKFLLVLDDVWNENEEKWEALKSLLRCNVHGSKILVTTRSVKVARIMGTTTPFQLKILSDDDCWLLFKRRAFGAGRAEETPNFIAIGKEIVKKCGGLPLAAKALGSMMGFKRGEGEWCAIRDSEIWRLPKDQTKIIPALRLSYDHLPSQLKQCFAYCSLFPKDYEIMKHKLIGMWIAENFISYSEDRIPMEDTANEYFNILLWSSFFQDVTVLPDGTEVIFKMHDLVHDLSQFVAGQECLSMEVGNERSIPQNCRYMSLVCDETTYTIPKLSSETKKLRSFLVLHPDHYRSYSHSIVELPEKMLSKLTHLRVLDLSRCRIEKLSNRIGKLVHLRFLDLSRTKIKVLPTSIAHLQNLRTLNLCYCLELQEFPKGMGNLSNLRHMDILGCKSLTCMPPGIGKLRNLQKLPVFVVAEHHGHSLSELQHLNLIRGEIGIVDLQNVKSSAQAIQAELKAKQMLHVLKLTWKNDAYSKPGDDVEGVLEALQPHPNLEKLEIKGYRGTNFPGWMMMTERLCSFTNLTNIKLDDLTECVCVPPLGQLPCLRHLFLKHLDSLRKIGREFYGDRGTFPKLESLQFFHMPTLETWFTTAPGRELFPCLTDLRILKCPALKAQPCIPSSIMTIGMLFTNVEVLEAGYSSLPPLKKLIINSCKGASSSAWENLQRFTTLEELHINGCEDLACIPEGFMQNLSSLQTLVVGDFPNLSSLGDGLQQCIFPSLRHLKIVRCPALSALPEWLEGLNSLESLEIFNCPKLTKLPDGIQNLISLRQLSISSCPHLERRCQRETGEDWHKIAHIQCINIGPPSSFRVQADEA